MCSTVAAVGRVMNRDTPGSRAMKRENAGCATMKRETFGCCARKRDAGAFDTLSGWTAATFRNRLGVCCVNREPMAFPNREGVDPP